MRTWPPILAFLFLLLTPVCSGQADGWHPTLGDAETSANNKGMPVLIHFHAWYCGPCQRMDREVFADSEVNSELATALAAVKIDVTHEPEVAARFGASTVPRDVLVLPDGTVRTINVGYLSKSAYLSMLRGARQRKQEKKDNGHPSVAKDLRADADSTVGMAGKPVRAEANKQGSIEPPTTTDKTESNSFPVGLDGYCPVSLFQLRKWVKGEEKFSAVHRDIEYRFASESDRQAFLNTPNVFAPQDLGCDPVVLTSDQIARAGNIRYGVFFDQKLFLFQSEENRAEFKANPLKYARIRSALRVDQIGGSRIQ